MERKLYEASLGGNVTSLIELLEEDPLVLHRVITGFYETPLHIAAMCGHVDFALKILSIKPELASELDSNGFCPLHLASTKKNVDMVKVLLEADPDVCCVTDEDGRTPIHLAAMKGRVEIMRELIQARSHAIKVLSDRRETILHLCVKQNRLEALKFLVKYLQEVDVKPTDHIHHHEESVISVNCKDIDGNTILHLAVARRQMKMIKYLLDSKIGVELNATNNRDFTAMDILTQSSETRGLKDIEIEDLLRDAGVSLRASKQQLKEFSTTDHDQTREQQLPRQEKSILGRKKWDDDHYNKWLETKQNTLMVVASLIATIAFQCGVNPPGGVWSGDGDTNIVLTNTVSVHDGIVNNGSSSPNSLGTSSPQHSKLAGTAIMAYYDPSGYLVYSSFNTLGFMASMSVIFLLLSGLRCIKRKTFVKILLGVLWVSISFTALSYLVAMRWLLPVIEDNDDIAHANYIVISRPITYAVSVWLGLLALVVLAHIVNFILKLLKLVLWLLKLVLAHIVNFILKLLKLVLWLLKLVLLKLGILKPEVSQRR